ncbi:MAG: ammonium transporter [Paludibacter sp.]|jgi:Amt family ammonium transporter|nr:ammonium transporter [Paludibacter sp.]
MKKYTLLLVLLAFCALSAVAQETTPTLDSGNTAWLIVATAFVFLMTIPGLALFYGGLVRRKNVLSVFMQCFILAAVISIEWVIVGYSLTFGQGVGVLQPFIGDFSMVFLNGIGQQSVEPSGIPTYIWVLFQGMFAVITPALIVGAFAERIKFKGFLVFSLLWALLIYNPLAHWVWGGGWLSADGAIDFAGGTVVHINAGIAALVMAIMLGKRHEYAGHALPPHNVPFVAIGAALLWIGWFGFNAGSGLKADGLAGNAFLVTHICTATAALVWALIEWIRDKRPTTVGVCTGAVAGLVAITPAAGTVGLAGAFIIGIVAAFVCFFMVAVVKNKFGYDDSLDAFGVHGIGGMVGAILSGVLATNVVSGALEFYPLHQLGVQLIAVAATIAYSGIGTFILFVIVEKFVGLKVATKEQAIGLDETQHGETAYTNFD